MLAGGLGAGALIALPDISLAGRPAAGSVAGPVAGASAGTIGAAGSAVPASRYVLLYGTPGTSPFHGGSFAAAQAPKVKSSALPAPQSVAAQLASTPVSSPDQSSVALVTVDAVSAGYQVTLTLVDSTTAVIEKQGSLTISDVPEGTNILATPVFAPGTTTIAVVLAITEPGAKRMIRKIDPLTGGFVTMPGTSYTSHHALAYFDTSSGSFAGPFHLGNAPALALSTVAANGSDLFLWTTAEPQASQATKGKGTAATTPQISAFPLGSGQPRFTVPAALPWPASEPVVTLPSGDVARLVNGRTVQVCSARSGDLTQTTIASLNVIRAKPSAITMETRSDGTVFMTKPGIGKAIITDPSDSFRVKNEISFPVPTSPLGAPWSKAVLSASGHTLYVLGAAKTGGVSAYDVATGKLTASYSQGDNHSGLYLLPSGTLLATSAANPRLTFFSSSLSPLGTLETSLQISAVF